MWNEIGFVVDRVHYRGKSYPIVSQAFGVPNGAGHVSNTEMIAAVPNKRIIIVQYLIGTSQASYSIKSGTVEKLTMGANATPHGKLFGETPWIIGEVGQNILITTSGSAPNNTFWGTFWWFVSDD